MKRLGLLLVLLLAFVSVSPTTATVIYSPHGSSLTFAFAGNDISVTTLHHIPSDYTRVCHNASFSTMVKTTDGSVSIAIVPYNPSNQSFSDTILGVMGL